MKGKKAENRPSDASDKTKDEQALPEMITLTHDIDGKPYLEGQAPKAVKELWEKGIEYEKIKTERMKLTKKEKEAKDALTALYPKYPDVFTPSDNDPKLLIYAVGGLLIDVQIKESYEVKTHKEPPAPPISNQAQSDAEKLKRGGTNGANSKGGKSPADIY